MKINILTSRFPYPIEKGDKLRIYHQIRLMSRFHEIYLFALDNGSATSADISEVSQYCKEIKIYQLPKWKRIWTVLIGLLHGLPIHVGYFYDKKLKNIILKDLKAVNADITMGQLIRVAPYLRGFEGKVWIDFMDSFSGNLQRRSLKAPWWEKLWLNTEVKLIRKMEQQTLRLGHVFTIISSQDKSEIDPLDQYNIQVLPNGVDSHFFRPSDFRNPSYDISFTGNMGYEPNIKAARFLMKEIGDRMAEDITIRVAGARPDKTILNLSNSRYFVSGWVDDMREVYWSGKIFVAPLFSGSGQQNKILEAMACGIPVITTTLVNNAIGAKAGMEILVADDLRSFIVQVDRLLNDEELMKSISEQARLFIEQNYDWIQIGQQMETFLKEDTAL